MQFVEKLSALCSETRRFADRFELLSNLFAVDVESAPTNLQMELNELQCCDTLKSNHDSVGAAQFPRFIPDTIPQLRTQAAQMLSMFGSTYLCEQLFSLMKMNKTSHRSRLTDEHLHSILRISSAQNRTPNIDGLASKKRCHVAWTTVHQIKSECSKLSLNFELSFLYALSCYCKTWTVNS